jgi:hypothetical protein
MYYFGRTLLSSMNLTSLFNELAFEIDLLNIKVRNKVTEQSMTKFINANVLVRLK